MNGDSIVRSKDDAFPTYCADYMSVVLTCGLLVEVMTQEVLHTGSREGQTYTENMW